MRRKGLRNIVLLCGLFLLWSSCTTNKTAWDLTAYINQGILNIAELEQRSLEIYASATGEHFKSDEQLADALRDRVIPYYRRFLDGLREIRPKEPEVQSLHGLYVHAAESLLDGFKTLLISLESQDQETARLALHLANQKIQQGREEGQRWRNTFMELSAKYKVFQESKKKK